MLLDLPTSGLEGYRSLSQRARVATEAWAQLNLYCAACDASALQSSAANTPVVDYECPKCRSQFQLKAQGRPFSRRIADAAYQTMFRAVQENRTPNLVALHYLKAYWKVQNLILIPRFAFSLSAIEKRSALSASARRAGWIGCNILLSAIPPDARIPMFVEGVRVDPSLVREQYARLRPLAKMDYKKRGWTLDVLNAVRQLGKHEFSLSDVYAFEEHLSQLHPANKHVRDKIRQQLQVLRDLDIIDFLGHGAYRLRELPAESMSLQI